MTLESYLLFMGAALLLFLVPGPDMIYLLTRSIAQGKRAGIAAGLGINSGGFVHLAASVTGLSAILLSSSLAFTVVKWIGAAYLIYIGIGALLDRSTPFHLPSGKAADASVATVFWQGFWSNALNPKMALFFLALLPQFVHPENGHVVGQLLLLGMTLIVMAVPFNFLLAVSASWVSGRLRRNSKMAVYLQKASGAIFIALGLRLAAEKA